MEGLGLSGRSEGRPGAHLLGLLSTPLNGLIVQALAEGPLRQSDLHRRLSNPAQTTLRGHLAKLEKLGAVERHLPDGSRHAERELTECGRMLLQTTMALEDWLQRAPSDPIQLGSVQAKGAVRALAGAWDSQLLRALAGAPLSLTQLDRLIGSFSYPALERRLAAMRATGLAQAVQGEDGTPYVVTPWARQAVGPIAAAIRFEQTFMTAEAPPLGPSDIEAVFLLATPISALPQGADGVCELAAELSNGAGRRIAGVQVAVDRGRVVSCIASLTESPRNWALASALDWLDAVVQNRVDRLRIGGDRLLACNLVAALHLSLYPSLIR